MRPFSFVFAVFFFTAIVQWFDQCLGEELVLNQASFDADFVGFAQPDMLRFRAQKSTELIDVDAERLIRFGVEPVVDFRSALLMTDGSLIVGRIDRIGKRRVQISGRYVRTQLEFDSIRGIALQLPVDVSNREELLQSMFSVEGGDDVLVTVDGDEVTGVLQFKETIDQAPLATQQDWIFKQGARSRKLAASVLRAVTLSPVLHPVRDPESGYWFSLDDGSRLAMRSIASQEENVDLLLDCGERLPFSGSRIDFIEAVKSIAPVSPSPSLLGQHKLITYKQQSTMSQLRWPLAVDLGLWGEPIVVAGSRYRHGIVMHSNAQAIYAIPKDNSRFQASIAVTAMEADSSLGSVVFRVLSIDQNKVPKLRFTSPIVRAGDHPIPLDVEIGGDRLILLIVTDADDGSSGDHAVWIDARFSGQAD